jgi:hypothetical protein
MVELAGQLAKQLNQPNLLFHASLMRTSRRILEGALDEAEQRAHATFDLGQRANQGGEAVIFFSELLLEIRRWQGRLPEMLDDIRDLAGLAGVDFGYSLIRYLYDAGERELAIERYNDVMQQMQLPPRRDLLAGATLCHLAYLAARAADAPNCARLYESLAPLAGTFANTTVAKPVTEHFLGMLSVALNDHDAAERSFSIAVEAHEKIRAPLLIAETQVEWARLLVDSDRGSERVATLLRAAGDTAKAYASVFLQRQINELRA